MSTEPRRRSRAKLVLAVLTFVLVLSAQPGESGALGKEDAVLSGLGFAISGTSRVFAFVWHALSSAAMSCAGR
ncbi:hypothetical protein [Amycolatopsis orientalis]|uniref:Uncharacterized protein n=1 Tax=Amycolatopsis orientalis TaxID=31958 RepID=A0A193BW55_AMYOR|nr:hypothetical protein [Amycolatopsis orientalis]ANN16466.1 hypothetical protein SD37_12930 [Amycolatopsis orientalis]